MKAVQEIIGTMVFSIGALSIPIGWIIIFIKWLCCKDKKTKCCRNEKYKFRSYCGRTARTGVEIIGFNSLIKFISFYNKKYPKSIDIKGYRIMMGNLNTKEERL